MNRLHKMIIKASILSVMAFLLISNSVLADSTATHGISITIPEIALLGLNNSGIMSFIIEPPLLPGNPPTFNPANSSRRLFYTSIISATEPTRKITGKLSANIDGILISLNATDPAGGVVGNAGDPVAALPFNLTNADQDIITGIRNCWTGRTDGSQLTYTPNFDPATLNNLDADFDVSVTVTYTLTDN